MSPLRLLAFGIGVLGFTLVAGCTTPAGAAKEKVEFFAVESLYILPPGHVPVSQLDHVPRITPGRAMAFPAELRYRGFVGHLTGFVGLLADGSVKQLEVIAGNSELLRAPAKDYVADLQFEVPTRGGIPVPSSFEFEFFVTDGWTYGPFVMGEGRKPNEGRVPTPAVTIPPISNAASRDPGSAEELATWRERVAQVHVGMTRAEVERILAPFQAGYAESTFGSRSRQDGYVVSPHYSVVVSYGSVNGLRDPIRPDDRVIAPAVLEHRPAGGQIAANVMAERRAFLRGMNLASGLIQGRGGLAGFWPTETEVAALYDSVVWLYARDLGVPPESLATDAGTARVAESLRADGGDDSMAFLAGAFARCGTDTGFDLPGGEGGYALATSVGELNQYNVQLVHVAGFPGRITIVVSDGGENPSAEFFSLMRKIRTEVTQETVQVSPSRL